MFVLLGFTALLVPFAVSKMPEGKSDGRKHIIFNCVGSQKLVTTKLSLCLSAK